jgi:hypothetical protein
VHVQLAFGQAMDEIVDRRHGPNIHIASRLVLPTCG